MQTPLSIIIFAQLCYLIYLSGSLNKQLSMLIKIQLLTQNFKVSEMLDKIISKDKSPENEDDCDCPACELGKILFKKENSK